MEQSTEATSRVEFPCCNLRSKAMYYGGEDDDGVFWCAKTEENVGPDGQPAGKTECCNGRSCYVG